MPTYEYSDHNRVMKKRFKNILNSKKEEARKVAYKDLIHYAGFVCKYAEDSIVPLSLLKGCTDTNTIRRIKVVSFFETHTNIIEKGNPVDSTK